jgi:hypothetical protein
MAIWSILQLYDTYILWPFGIFNGYLVYILPFWYVVPRKIWQTCSPDGCPFFSL